MTPTMAPAAALARLRAGNRRFTADPERPGSPGGSWLQRAGAQAPFAAVLGCADSRVPVERVFDQGFGELFVIRVAGNIAGPTQVGSVEYGVRHLGIRLVVVLGHSGCGAVDATVATLDNLPAPLSSDFVSIVDEIRPAAVAAQEAVPKATREELVRIVVRRNAEAAAARRRVAAGLEPLVSAGQVLVTPAEYSLETGVVEFSPSPLLESRHPH